MTENHFELDTEGVRALLRSQEVLDMCESFARDIQARAGDGFEVDTYVGVNRGNAMIWADTNEARRACLRDNRLLKAVGK